MQLNHVGQPTTWKISILLPLMDLTNIVTICGKENTEDKILFSFWSAEVCMDANLLIYPYWILKTMIILHCI